MQRALVRNGSTHVNETNEQRLGDNLTAQVWTFSQLRKKNSLNGTTVAVYKTDTSDGKIYTPTAFIHQRRIDRKRKHPLHESHGKNVALRARTSIPGTADLAPNLRWTEDHAIRGPAYDTVLQ